MLLSLLGVSLDVLPTIPQKTYYLCNTHRYLRELCGKEEVRACFKKPFKRALDTYMVVAIHTVQMPKATSPSASTSSSIEEKVFAVQYQKIKFTWYDWILGKQFDRVGLEDRAHWTVVDSSRGGGNVDCGSRVRKFSGKMTRHGQVYKNGEYLIVFQQ